jgi:hypothetical protein
MLKKARKILLYCSACIAAISMFVFGILENNYIKYPRAPDPAHGLVVPHEAKQSVIVYVTQTQSTTIQIVTWIVIVSGVLTIGHLMLNQWWPLEDNK